MYHNQSFNNFTIINCSMFNRFPLKKKQKSSNGFSATAFDSNAAVNSFNVAVPQLNVPLIPHRSRSGIDFDPFAHEVITDEIVPRPSKSRVDFDLFAHGVVREVFGRSAHVPLHTRTRHARLR
jgi:hypothetical protein